jgi:hypothetical protein
MSVKIVQYDRRAVYTTPMPQVIESWTPKETPSFWGLLSERFDHALLYLLAHYTGHYNLKRTITRVPVAPELVRVEYIEINTEDIKTAVWEVLKTYSNRTGQRPVLIIMGGKQYSNLRYDFTLDSHYAFGVPIRVRADIDGIICLGKEDLCP